jgi:copper transport protein
VGVASAHALLVKSDPEGGAVVEQAPGKVVAWFSQELESRLSSMRVFDVQGRQIDNGDGGVDLNDLDHTSLIVTLPLAMPAGTYTVRWSVVSVEDGDATEGEFTFSVGGGTISEASVASPVDANSNWLIGGIAAGLILFPLAVLFMVRRRQLARRGS